MNREIISKKVKGKGVVYSNPCPRSTAQTAVFVGNPRYCSKGKCKWFNKLTLNKEGKRCVFCTFTSMSKTDLK